MRFDVLALVLMVGCAPVSASGDAAIGDAGPGSGATCPASSTLDEGTFARGFFTTYCTRCHASTVTGASRMGAPRGYDWDDITIIRAHAREIDLLAAIGPSHANRTMPPNGLAPSDAERAQLGEWLACGAP